MSSGFNIVCADDIFDIPDVSTGMRILNEWRVNSKGIDKKEAVQEALIDAWKVRNPAQKDEITYGLKDAITKSKRNRDELLYFYNQMVNLYRQLPKNHQTSLNKVFPNLEDTTYRKVKDLKSNECAILVAGESVAGKTTFINLLLGEDLLPTSQLACTATFCELRFGKDKKAVCYSKDGQKRTIDLSTQEGIEDLQQSIAYVTDDVDDNENERIEVYWPFEILEDGIVIIDTPGIGTSKEMTERIQQYMCKAFGCIYIINSSSAGGIQKGRIMEFLRTVMNLSEDQFNPRTTMFVCNKWEQVPAKDKEEIMRQNHYKLRQCYPELREDQIYYFSTEIAKRAVAQDVILEQYKTLLNGVSNLLPASLENKHEMHYRWLSTVLKRTQFLLKVSKFSSRENIAQVKAKMEAIEKQMDNLQRNAKAGIQQLQEDVRKEADSLHFKVINLLSSAEFRNQIRFWDPSDCPKSDSKWKKVSMAATELIAQRIMKQINDWERGNSIKAGIKGKIIGKFQRDFELMEDQINDIEGIFLGEETRILADIQKTIKRNNKKDKKNKTTDNKVNMVGIGGVVAVLGTLGKESKDIFKKYKKERSQAKMAEATDQFLQNVLRNNQDLKENLYRFVQKCAKGIDKIAEIIPDFLAADRQMLETLREEAEETVANASMADLSNFTILQGELDLFYADYMMHVDYKMSDIHCQWERKDMLGKGSFAKVYKGVLKLVDGKSVQVALKKSRDKITKLTITDILLEDRTMREVKHKNFIEYYGNALEQTNKGTRWIMIIECCLGSLKDVFVDKSDYKIDTPANSKTFKDREEAIKNMAEYGIQLCTGLNFLHSKKLVHRDLKLENVLISSEKIVKLTDVGLTKPEVDISGTKTGSPAYMAPEVLVPKGVYNRSADIYSLGIMIWEMWYGIDAAEHIGVRIEKLSSIEAFVEEKKRPSLSLVEKPSDDWIKLIESCWDQHPTNRPSAKDVLAFFSAFVK